MKGFAHSGAKRPLVWDMTQAAALAAKCAELPIGDASLVAPVLDRFVSDFLPRLSELRAGIVHNDLNLHNLLVDPEGGSTITGCIDFGDMVHAPYIVDLGVAAAYQASRRATLSARSSRWRGPITSACRYCRKSAAG